MSPSSLPRLRELTLVLSNECNLGCSYCYVPRGARSRMSDRVRTAALALFRSYADPESELSLSFFGGEPFLLAGDMHDAIRLARESFGSSRRLRAVTPTNGLLLRAHALELCRREGIDLAISLDGVSRSSGRPYVNGQDSTPDLLARLPEVLATFPSALARMTVTPGNVAELAHNVRAIGQLGFGKIFYLPDFDQPWSDEAIALWKREHQRIGTWLVGARGAGIRVPDLPTWRGIESRLLLHKPKRACGAGERLAAVTPDGRLVPCYRFAFEPGDDHVIGDVLTGFSREAVRERFVALDPLHLRPEHGQCGECGAQDGCTHVCPAQGMLKLGDPLGVPDVVCRLMRAQVDAIRPFAGARKLPKRRAERPAWAAAVMSAAMATAISSSSCGGSVETQKPDTVAAQDASADTTASDAEGPGVCPVQLDASSEAFGPPPDATDELGPGVCPVQVDASTDAYGPGICDLPPDAGDEYMPGLCPYAPDGSDEYGPGVCPSPGLC